MLVRFVVIYSNILKTGSILLKSLKISYDHLKESHYETEMMQPNSFCLYLLVKLKRIKA